MIFEDTSTDLFYNEYGNMSPTAFIIIISILLILWFISGLVFALLVRGDLRRRERRGLSYIIIVLLTSIVGFIIYILVRNNEKCELNDDPICEVDEVIQEEQEEEFFDEIEEEIEEEVEELIDKSIIEKK